MIPPLINLPGHFKGSSLEREGVRLYLTNNIASASMVAHALNIPLRNMTRHKAKLRDQKILRIAGMGICKITGRKVDFITCIPNILIIHNDEIEKA